MTLKSKVSRVQRLLLALEMADLGIEIRRAQLARAYPQETEAEIELRLSAWLRKESVPESWAPWGRLVEPKTILK